MRTCHLRGHVGGADIWYPDTGWDLDVGALHPRVACTRLSCEACGAEVHHLVGFELGAGLHIRGPGRRGGEPLDSALELVSNPYSRVYACGCTSYATVRTESLLPVGDDEQVHELPWACAGHPGLTLPAEVDGVALTTSTDWSRLIADALAGRIPVAWRPPGILHERHPAVWLARIVAHLTDRALAQRISREVASHLLSPDLRVRRAAINFYRHCSGAPGSEKLGEALTGHLSLFEGERVTGARRDLASELRECIVVQLATHPTDVLEELVKGELLAGRGTTAFLLLTSRLDPAWLVEHGATLVSRQLISEGRLRRLLAATARGAQG